MLSKNSTICSILIDQKESDLFNTSLAENGYRKITNFSSAKDAYEVAIRQQFDLFVIRMEMSEMSGVVFIQKIRETGNYGLETHLFICDTLSPQILNVLYEYDISYVLTKPFNKKSISEKFAHLIKTELNLPKAEASYREARIALFNKMPDMAEELANKLNQEHPKSEKILLLLGEIAEQKNAFDTAISFYKEANNANPKSAIAPHKLAQVLIKTGKNKEAAELLEVAAILNPYNLKLLENAGLSNYNIQNYEKAQEYAKQLKGIDTQNKSASIIEANSKIATGDYTGLTAALKNSHDDREIVSFLNNAGVKLAKDNDAIGALKMYQSCIDTLQSSKYLYAIYYNMGIAHKKLGDNKSAILYYEKSVKLKPDFEKAKAALTELKQQ